MGEVNNFRSMVETVVENRWKKERLPTYLADIPSQLSRLGFDYKSELAGVGLKRAMSLFTNESVRLIKSDLPDADDAAVPIHVTESVEELYRRLKARRQIRHRGSIPRFEKGLFSAFAIPLTSYRRGLINLDPVRFRDFDEQEDFSLAFYEIPGALIRDKDQNLEDSAIAERVSDWLETTDLNPSDFIIGQPVKRTEEFWESLSKLPDSDLERILIPLDIVRRTLR